jgi:hypothetical protein
VKLATSILNISRADGLAQPGNWAIDDMVHYSEVPMDNDERKLLADLGGLQSVPVIAAAGTPRLVCVLAPQGKFFKWYHDPATENYTKGPDMVDASGCQ